MDNNKSIVCVIDGVTTAILAAILFKNKKIDFCIIEEKYSVYDEMKWSVDVDNRIMIDLILSDLQIENMCELRLPCILLDNRKKISTWIRYKKISKKIYRFFDENFLKYKNACFWGAGTSTLMHFLPPDAEIIPLDHGMEVISRLREIRVHKRASVVRERIKQLLYSFTNFNGQSFLSNKGYTLANCFGDYFRHVDYTEFENKTIEMLLMSARAFVCKANKKFALFLMPTQAEVTRIMQVRAKSDKTKVDFKDIFSRILDVIPDIDYLILKFHPDFYKIESEKEDYYKDILKTICDNKKVICLGIDEFLGCHISHALAAEIIVRYVNFHYIIAMYSTALFNIAKEGSKVKCYNLSGFIRIYDEHFKGCFGDTGNMLNPHIINVQAN